MDSLTTTGDGEAKTMTSDSGEQKEMGSLQRALPRVALGTCDCTWGFRIGPGRWHGWKESRGTNFSGPWQCRNNGGCLLLTCGNLGFWYIDSNSCELSYNLVAWRPPVNNKSQMAIWGQCPYQVSYASSWILDVYIILGVYLIFCVQNMGCQEWVGSGIYWSRLEILP